MSEPHEVVVESDHMTGPDHWREAQAGLEWVEGNTGPDATHERTMETIEAAKVHALLAIGAALGLQLPADSASGEMFRRVAGYKVGDGLGESIG